MFETTNEKVNQGKPYRKVDKKTSVNIKTIGNNIIGDKILL